MGYKKYNLILMKSKYLIYTKQRMLLYNVSQTYSEAILPAKLIKCVSSGSSIYKSNELPTTLCLTGQYENAVQYEPILVLW